MSSVSGGVTAHSLIGFMGGLRSADCQKVSLVSSMKLLIWFSFWTIIRWDMPDFFRLTTRNSHLSSGLQHPEAKSLQSLISPTWGVSWSAMFSALLCHLRALSLAVQPAWYKWHLFCFPKIHQFLLPFYFPLSLSFLFLSLSFFKLATSECTVMCFAC